MTVGRLRPCVCTDSTRDFMHCPICPAFSSPRWQTSSTFLSLWLWKGLSRLSRVTQLVLRLCCANCNLAGVGGDGSHWYCQSPCFPITIACTPTWLPDWQCYFRGNYYDSDYVNHFTLCSMWHQIAVARATRFLFPLMCLLAVWGLFSLFTVAKLFKNSCSTPLQCYYLWAR